MWMACRLLMLLSKLLVCTEGWLGLTPDSILSSLLRAAVFSVLLVELGSKGLEQ